MTWSTLPYLARLEKKLSHGKALPILAHRLARTVYHLLRREQAFAMNKFLNG